MFSNSLILSFKIFKLTEGVHKLLGVGLGLFWCENYSCVLSVQMSQEVFLWVFMSFTPFLVFYGNLFILFLLKQVKFKVVRVFVSQVLYEIESNLFAIRLIIDRIAEFQGSQQNLVQCLKLITELQLSHPHWMRGISHVDYISKRWKF